MKKIIFILLLLLLGCGNDSGDLKIKTYIWSDKATLYWEGVTTYTDGSPLLNPRYKVYWGSMSRFYINSLDMGTALTYDVTDKPIGTYFAVTAYDEFGAESDFSNEVRK